MGINEMIADMPVEAECKKERALGQIISQLDAELDRLGEHLDLTRQACDRVFGAQTSGETEAVPPPSRCGYLGEFDRCTQRLNEMVDHLATLNIRLGDL